jgi:hypothetical protein
MRLLSLGEGHARALNNRFWIEEKATKRLFPAIAAIAVVVTRRVSRAKSKGPDRWPGPSLVSQNSVIILPGTLICVCLVCYRFAQKKLFPICVDTRIKHLRKGSAIEKAHRNFFEARNFLHKKIRAGKAQLNSARDCRE